jgi:hypothetical protein
MVQPMIEAEIRLTDNDGRQFDNSAESGAGRRDNAAASAGRIGESRCRARRGKW